MVKRWLLTTNWRILGEYEDNVNPNARKGDWRSFCENDYCKISGIPNVCTIVHITSLSGNGTDFEEFPTDNALSNFDPDDRKFIAVAHVYESTFINRKQPSCKQPIASGTDSERHSLETDWKLNLSVRSIFAICMKDGKKTEI